MKDSEMIIRKDMINDFKNRIEKQLEDAVQYNHTQEDLWYLKWQVIGLCDTFGLITHKEAEKFVGMIDGKALYIHRANFQMPDKSLLI